MPDGSGITLFLFRVESTLLDGGSRTSSRVELDGTGAAAGGPGGSGSGVVLGRPLRPPRPPPRPLPAPALAPSEPTG